MTAFSDAYADKQVGYFTGERAIIDGLSVDPTRSVLEIGCGDGATGAYAKQVGKCGRYVGIELVAAAAQIASRVLDEVHTANIETFEPPFVPGAFDVLIASEVLEHLVDPWAVLRKLRPYLKPGAMIFASSPNVAHRSVLGMLLAGGWDLAPEGVMDRTHLRWFTPRTYAAMFTECGYDVLSVGPLARPSAKAKVFNALTGGKLAHLLFTQIMLTARRPLEQDRPSIE
jgi:2-polyprenyl-3-methyl-5-hydroxy-6-metoxy-1,4-benzoquinol methylase